MTTITTVDAERAAEKLREWIAKCDPRGYTTLPVSIVLMAAKAIEQQAAELALYREQQPRMQEAIIEALTPAGVEVEA